MTEYIIAIITAITSFIGAYVASSLAMKNIKQEQYFAEKKRIYYELVTILPDVEKFSAQSDYMDGTEGNCGAENKISIINLPVRKEILKAGGKIKMVDEKAIREKKEIDFLIMSGGEGSGDMGAIIEKLLKVPNSRISAVAGRNTKLKEVLEKKFENDLDRVTIYGFVKDVENLMTTHDVAIVRGSPNVLMECITCNLPVIVTGALPGQEEGNIDFILLNDLGLLCHKNTGLIRTVNKLLVNDKERLIRIKKNQLAFRDLEAGKKIVERVLTLSNK